MKTEYSHEVVRSVMECQITNGNLETTVSLSNVVNPDSYDAGAKAYVFLDGGFVVGVVLAEYYSYCEQDALDELADSGKIDHLQISEEEMPDYIDGEDERCTRLGNAREPFDIDTLDMWIIPQEQLSWLLMTPDRVMARLDETRDRLDSEYQKVSVYAEEWQEAYTKVKDIEDAITFYRLLPLR